MHLPPQLAVDSAPTGRAFHLPFAELPKEQQIDLLAQQMLQQQQLIAMQQMQIASLSAIQVRVEAQNARLQELAVVTNRLAEDDTAATKEALAASQQENLAKDARIAGLEAQLNSQKDAYTASQAAARQALATQAKVMEAIKEQNAILGKAFAATEKMLREFPETQPNHLTFRRWEAGYTQFRLHLTHDSYQALSGQAKETRALLQKNIQTPATEAQNIGDQ